MSQSCIDCPSYVPPGEVQEEIGTSFGRNVGYCRTRGIPLGMPDAPSPSLTKHLKVAAEDCPHFAKPVKAKGSKTQRVGFVGATPVVIKRREIDSTRPNNCRTCLYYRDPAITADSVGWTVGMCLAKGNVLPPKTLPTEAKVCEVGITTTKDQEDLVESVNAANFDSFVLLPIYDLFGRPGDEVITEPVVREYTDPREYESDIPVTDEHAEMGIRAWRKLLHPTMLDKKSPIYLPIFRDDFFDEAERTKIPQAGDPSSPELYFDYQNLLWAVAVNIMGLDRTPALIGPAGTGKSEFFNYLAWLCQMPFDRISITKASETWDIIGKHLVETDPKTEESVTVWVDGRLPRRWQKPGVLLIDEPNTGPDEIWQTIRPLTDNSKQLVLDQDKGQKVERHPFCLFGMAMNPAWDMRYIGTNELNEADGNRLGSIWTDYPPPDVEREIIIAKCHDEGYKVPEKMVDDVMNIAEEIRRMADPDEGSLQISWGVRLQVAAALYTQFSTLLEAYRMTVADRLAPTEREMILNVVKGYDTSYVDNTIGRRPLKGSLMADTKTLEEIDPLRAAAREIQSGNADAATRAYRAMARANQMRPGMEAFARALTKNPKFRVAITGSGLSYTDGEMMAISPPMELGDDVRHQRLLCDSYDHYGLSKCPGCRASENILMVTEHEIGHVVHGSFDTKDSRKMSWLLNQAAEWLHERAVASDYRPEKNEDGEPIHRTVKQWRNRITAAIKRSDKPTLVYLNAAMTINPWLKMLWNVIEDARVNAAIHRVRPGSRRYFSGYYRLLLDMGILMPDGSISTYAEQGVETQVSMAILFQSMQYEMNIFEGFDPTALEIAKLPEVLSICEGAADLPTMVDSFEAADTLLRIIQGYGLMPDPGMRMSTPDDEVVESDLALEDGDPEQGSASQDNGDGEGSDQEEGDDGGQGASGPSSGAASSSSDDSDDAGEQGSDSGQGGSGGSGASGGDSTQEGDNTSGRQDVSEEGEGEESSEGEGEAEEGTNGEDSSAGEADRGDDEEGNDDEECLGAGQSDGQDDEDDGAGETESESSDGDSNSDGETTQEQLDKENEEAAKRTEDAMRILTGHATDEDLDQAAKLFEELLEKDEDESTDNWKPSLKENSTREGYSGCGDWGGDDGDMSIAHDQHQFFRRPSTNVAGVNMLSFDKLDDPAWNRKWISPTKQVYAEQNGILVNAPSIGSSIYDSYGFLPNRVDIEHFGKIAELERIKQVVTRQLGQARRIFTENKAERRTRNLPQGRLTSGAGPKLKVGNNKVFGTKKRPDIRDYAVVIGLDVSGSTGNGIGQIMKSAAFAMAELMHQLGVSFAFYCHTSMETVRSRHHAVDLDLMVVKDWKEAWNNKTIARLTSVMPSGGNVDGHTMQTYRRLVQAQPEKQKLITYFTDGAMPLENYDEELEILRYEINLIKRLPDVDLLAIGAQTRSPEGHGLETVQLDVIEDMETVVRRLKTKLL